MTILITLLTTVLVLNCFFLVLLILIQLPKKESGSGLAFGGGALDMALGAGAGNVLTRLTKYSASLFLVLCLVLAVIGSNSGGNTLADSLNKPVDSVPAVDPNVPAASPGTRPAPEAPTEAPATAPATEGTEEPPATTEKPATTETTPAPDAATTETPAQPGEGEEKK